MENSKNLENFLKLVSKDKSGLLEEMEWRKANRDWLRKSGRIAIKVLRSLREKNMSQKNLAELMGVSPQHINKICKGQENLSLETISKLENALGIKIFEMADEEIKS